MHAFMSGGVLSDRTPTILFLRKKAKNANKYQNGVSLWAV